MTHGTQHALLPARLLLKPPHVLFPSSHLQDPVVPVVVGPEYDVTYCLRYL